MTKNNNALDFDDISDKKGRKTRKNKVNGFTVVKALHKLGTGKAHKVSGIYEHITDNEPSTNDCRAFVRIYKAISNDDGSLAAKYANELDSDDDFVVKRGKFDENLSYDGWALGLAKADQ